MFIRFDNLVEFLETHMVLLEFVTHFLSFDFGELLR